MKPLLTVAALLLSLSNSIADDWDQITVIDSATPTQAIMAKPDTYLGEAFIFEEQHSADIKVQVGLWEAEMGKLTLDNFPFTEYVLIISGSVIVTEKNGTSRSFKAGDSFVIPNGWTGAWDVQERMKKQIVRIGTSQ